MIDVEKLRELAEKLHASCDNGLDPDASYEAGDIILAMAEERERMREALERINKAPTVMDGGSIQWCRNLAAKTLRALGEGKA